ncbi:carboxypeptidase regulatory-like domain-containing protein [bacterium]|nr:MAG: carboxypeptidase regulatory-like domain-containing protein [bacterium]
MLSTNVLSRLSLWPSTTLIAITLVGCGSKTEAPTSNGSAPVSSSASASAETERSSSAAAVKPPKGFGNAQGRVFWNEKPAANIKATLCETISFVSGCSGKTYTARTDKDGNYTIDKVPPGDYGLAIQVFDTDNFVYPTNGLLSAAKFAVKDGETLDIRATNLYKTDLQIATPKAGEVVKTSLPKLTWKPYAGATNYEITLMTAGGSGGSQNLKSSATTVSPETPLLNGSYQWEVVARNANGIKIASTATATPFKVVGQAGSTKVDIVIPKVEAKLSGVGVKFQWKAHPLAQGYQIYLAASGAKDPILAFKKVDGTQYALDQTLKAGDYYWTVAAVRDGKHFAQSEINPFTVQ